MRERIAEVHTQFDSGAPRRYGVELERAIVDYALERSAAGITQETIAADLGLSLSGLGKWLRHARLRLASGRQPFAPSEGPWPIAVVDDAAQAAVGIPAPEPEPTPLMLVLRIEEVYIGANGDGQTGTECTGKRGRSANIQFRWPEGVFQALALP